MSTTFESSLERLRFIARAKQLGCSLERAARVLSAEPAEGPCDDTCECVSDTGGADDSGPGLDAGGMSGRLEDWNALLGEKQELM